MFLEFLAFYYFSIGVQGGFVLPDQPNPIVPYRNNEQAWGEYVFYVSFQSRISNNAQIQIVYPQEYDASMIVLKRSDLMDYDDSCPVQIQYSTNTFCPDYTPKPDLNSVPPQSLVDRTLNIFLYDQALNAGSYIITLKYNKNPTSYGSKSTGFFIIRTYYQGVMVDSNQNFGTIGFAPQYLSYIQNPDFGVLNNDGSNLGGYLTNYVIQFKTTLNVAQHGSFRFEFAEGFDISGLQCFLKDTGQDLKCTTVGQRVYFAGVNADLPAGQHSIQLRNVINPYATGASGVFVFETLKPYVNTVQEYYVLAPVTIQPGQVINPSVAGYPLNKNLRVQYTIKFTPMNQIPLDGQIIYTFPSAYQLDKTCVIAYGLSPAAPGGQVSCTASQTTITIKDFALFNSQEICLQIYAVNPASSTIQKPFTVKTYSTFGRVGGFKQIDQNLDAGQIQISDIQSPYFIAVDMYKKFTNLTLGQIGPIDFRIYPMPGNELPLYTNGVNNFGEISIQIPLWWKLQGQTYDGNNIIGSVPSCMFGAEAASTCGYRLQYFTFTTASSTKYQKFPSWMGLGQCDVPISLSNIQLPPIPGRYDFRVITMANDTYLNFVTPPLEQDLYTVEIAATAFQQPTSVTCTSKDQVDQEMVCYASITVGLPIPYEGAINFNMSTLNDTYNSISAWPNDLGMNVANDTTKKIPCTVIIAQQVLGITGSSHPQVGCYVTAGSPSRPYAIIQVRGFKTLISTGTVIEIYIPQITSCTAYDLNCVIVLTSTYTTNFDVPYTMNFFIANVALVVKGSISQDVTSNGAGGTTTDSALSATFSGLEVCTPNSWTFKFTYTGGSIGSGAHILLKFPRDRWIDRGYPIYTFTGMTSTEGSVYLIDIYDKNMLYYFLKITKTLTPTSQVFTFYLNNVRSPLETPGMNVNMVYWVNQRRIGRITFPKTIDWLDGGILNPSLQILPKPSTTTKANRKEAIDMDFDSNILFQTSFQTCHTVPVGGLIEVQIQPELLSTSTTCNIWSGVTSAPQGLGFSHTCQAVTIASKNYYQITGFYDILPLSIITISFTGLTGSSAATGSPITIKTYFDSSQRSSNPSNATNLNDFYRQTLKGIDVTGTKVFPNKLFWGQFQIIDQKAVEGTRGEFYMYVNYSYDVPAYSAGANTARLIFTFPSYFQMPPGASPYCRIDGYLCPVCDWNNGVLTMSMTLNGGLQKNKNHLVMISSRGADYSSSTREGLHLSYAGTYQIQVTTSNTGNNNEATSVVLDISPKKLTQFWVWSNNKIGSDPQGNDPNATEALYILYFTTPQFVPASNGANPATMTISFLRVVGNTFLNGFEQDLGTGYPQRYDLPCVHKGQISLIPGATKLKCRLFLGSYPNPVQIIVSDFLGFSAGSYEIHIPRIQNPNITLQLVKVGLTISVAQANGNVYPLYESFYDLINSTTGRTSWGTGGTPSTPQISADVQTINRLNLTTYKSAPNPTFAVNTIDTKTQLSLSFASKAHNLGGGSDCIIFTLPDQWVLPYGQVTCTFTQGNPNCMGYPQAHQIAVFITSSVPKDTLVTGTVDISTPPYQVLVSDADPPIWIQVYSRSKLVDMYNISFTQKMQSVTVPVTVTVDQKYYSQIATYTIIINNKNNIPSGGAFTISYPPELSPREYGCRNDIIGGSQLSSVGFTCTNLGSQLLITGFPAFIGPGTIRILIRMQNPSETAPQPGSWNYSSYYLNEQPLNKLITNGTAASPALTNPTVIYYWDTPYCSRTRVTENGRGQLEFRIVLGQSSLTGSMPLRIVLPFTKVNCRQFLCLWDSTPWFDNHNDNFWPAQSCIYTSSNKTLTVFPPLSKTIQQSLTYRLIITTQNEIDGLKGLVLPPYGLQTFTIMTENELLLAKTYIPKINQFNFFECYSLITNIGFKNMFKLQFTPGQPIQQNGYFILYVPTVNEWGNPLFDDDMGTGKQNGDEINCFARSGFLNNVVLKCYFYKGSRLLGTPVQIKITGSWTFSLGTTATYIVEIDEFYNPIVSGDNNHVEMRFESYTPTNALLDQGFSYDFTLKNYTYVTGTLPAPKTSTLTISDQSVTYDLLITSPVPLYKANLYDWFVVEFTKPSYLTQPQTITYTTPPSAAIVLQGHNWLVIDVNDLSASSQPTYSLKKVNNPVILPISGVSLTGYAIRDRVVVGVYNYTSISDFVVALGGSTNEMFTIAPVDYTTTTIPKSSIVKFKVKIRVSDKSPGAAYGSVIDLIAPTGYTLYPNCINDVSGGSQATTTIQDYLTCTVNTSTKFPGRSNLSISGYDAMVILQNLTVIITALTPASATAALTWDFKCYQDFTRQVQLFDGQIPNIALQAYPTFTDFAWTPQIPKTIRVNSNAPFSFNLLLPSAVTSANSLTVAFPSAATINLPSGATIYCSFATSTARYLSPLCASTGSPITLITIQFPLEPGLAANTLYTVEITSYGGDQVRGLSYGTSGKFTATLSLIDATTTTTSMYFEVLPFASFTSPNIRIINQLDGVSTTFIVTFQTTVSIPSTGKIVVGFPTKSLDGTVRYFADDLASTAQTSGNPFSCSSTNSALGGFNMDCRINKQKGIQPRTEITIQGFTNAISAGNQLSFVIRNVRITYAASGASIPLELYTLDGNLNKLEIMIFNDWVSPVPATTGYGSSMTVTMTRVDNTIQASAQKQTFSGLNFATAMSPTSYLVFEYPVATHDLSNTITYTSPTAGCLGGTVQVIANYIIITQQTTPATKCTGTVNFVLNQIVNAYSSVKATYTAYICHERACAYSGTTSLQSYLAKTYGGTVNQITTLPNQYIYPLSCVTFDVSFSYDVKLPASSQITIAPSSTYTITVDRIEVITGLKQITVSKSFDSARGEMRHILTLKSDYNPATDGLVTFRLYGQLPFKLDANQPIYKFNMYVSYQGSPVYEEANPPQTVLSASSNYLSTTTLGQNKAYIISINAIPGIVGNTDSIIYLTLPTLNVPTPTSIGQYTYSYLIQLDGIQLSSSVSSCTITWVITQIPSNYIPTCSQTSQGIYTISNMPIEGTQDPMVVAIDTFQFSKAGMLTATVVVSQVDINNNPTQLGVYNGYTMIHTSNSMNTFTPTIRFKDQRFMLDNIIQIQFSLPSSNPTLSGTSGALYLDVLSPVDPSWNTPRKLLCQVILQPGATCYWYPASRLSQLPQSYTIDGYQNVLNSRVVISGFSDISSSSATVQIYFDHLWTSDPWDIKFKHFQFGYYAYGYGNQFIYQFGQNFQLDIEAGTVAPTTSSVSITGPTQGLTSMTFSFSLSGGSTFTNGDQIYIKFKDGYHLDLNTNNYLKPGLNVPSSSDFSLSSGGSCYFDPAFAAIICTSSGSGSSATLTVNNMESPFTINSNISQIATMYVISTSNQNKLLWAGNISLGGTISPATISSITVQQLDTKLFYISFTLPTNFQAFNNYDCIPGQSCPQTLSIQSSALVDFESYDIGCGIQTSIILQNNPTKNTYMFPKFASNTLSLNGFSVLKSTAPICVYIRTVSVPPASSATFTVSITHWTQTVATGTSSSINVQSIPQGLVGYIQSQFGYMDYIDTNSNFEKSTQAQYVFRFTLGFTPTSGGQFKLQSTQMNFASFKPFERLRCFFRQPTARYLSFYSPLGCVVDTVNQWILVPYKPSVAFSTTTQYELVIQKDQLNPQYLSLPSITGSQKINVFFESGTTVQALSVITVDVFEKQSTKVNFRNFISHTNYSSVFQVQYTVSYPVGSTAYIQIEFPISEYQTGASSLTNYHQLDLGTAKPHGFKINCLDKQGNLGANYQCQVFQGLSGIQGFYSYVRISGIPSLSVGSIVKVNLMGIRVPLTVNQINPVNIRIVDSVGYNYEYYTIKDAIYVLSAYVGTATSQTTANMSPLTTSSIVDLSYQMNTPVAISTSTQSTVLFQYNPDLWAEDYSIFKALVNSVNAIIDPLDEARSFITFPNSIASSTSTTIEITKGLQNPLYSGAFTSICYLYWINYYQGQIQSAHTDTISKTLTLATVYASQGTLTQSSQLQSDNQTILSIPVTLSQNLKVGVTAAITLSQTTFAVNQAFKCSLVTGNLQYSTNCSVDTTNVIVSMTINQAIAKNTIITFQIQVKLPSTAGSNYGLTLAFYKNWTKSQLYQSFSFSNSITVSQFAKLYYTGVMNIYSPQTLLMAGEQGPLQVTIAPTISLSPQVDYVTIDSNWLGTLLELPTGYPTPVELRCFWDDMAAFMCNYDGTAKKITIYTPTKTGLTMGKNYTLFVSPWRAKPFGVLDFNWLWTPSTPVAKLQNIPIVTSKETLKRDVVIQNYRFSKTTAPFITVHSATVHTSTSISVRFKMIKGMASALGISWGRVILTIPTGDDISNAPQFPDGFGRFTSNAQEIDCNCNTCPSSATPMFRCYVYLGAQDKGAPSQIWLDPQGALSTGDVVDLTIPKIKLPPTVNSYAKLSLLAFEYSSSQKKTTNISEIVTDWTFVTHADAYQIQSNVNAPTFTPDLVGSPSSVSFVSNNAYSDVQCDCHDRWILETNDSAMIFEDPKNPGALTLQTTATNHKVIIYPLAKWIEFIPTVNLTQSSSSQTLSVINLKNMPYEIPYGVNYSLYLLIDTGLRNVVQYKPKATASVNSPYQQAVNQLPQPGLVLQPTYYELIYQPFNKVPMTKGMMTFDFPDYQWTFTDAYCKVTSGLTDCACNILSITKQIVIQDCIADYAPIVNGMIKVTFNIINPPDEQTTIPFVFKSYWDKNQPYKIDVSNSFQTNGISIKSGGILRVSLFERYEAPIVLCGGRVGPIRLNFNLKAGDLYYPNDYIQLNMWGAFTPAPNNQEIICYFNNPNNPLIYHIKSYRCEFMNDIATIYIPEEIDINRNTDWELVLTSRGSNLGDGWLISSPSQVQWVTFSTSSTNDKGWFTAKIPGCPFTTTSFTCQNVGHEASTLSQPAWSIFNFVAQTQDNQIPAGDPTVARYSRFLFEFYTHNEIDKIFPADLTGRIQTPSDRAEIACNGPVAAQGNSYIQCQNIIAGGTTSNSTPSYVTAQYYQSVAKQTDFTLQIAQFMNGFIEGQAHHIKINMQVQQDDGTFYSQNEHYCWNVPSALLPPPNPTSVTSQVSRSFTQVNRNMGYSYYSVNLDQDLDLGDVVTFQFSYPYTLPKTAVCNQYDPKQRNLSKSIPCTSHPFNQWFVLPNSYVHTSGQQFLVRENYNFYNPPFTYDYTGQKSLLRAFVWKSNQLIYNISLANQSPTVGTMYLTLQTTEAENPENQWVKYHVGLHIQTYTSFMKHIRVWVAKQFQNVRNCRVNRGLIMKDPSQLNNQITCVISTDSSGSYSYMLEIDNFAPYAGDGWFIIDLELLNPSTAGWTGVWNAITYESKTNLTYLIDKCNFGGQQGQIWVGKVIRQPNLFRVYLNTISFENRRAKTDEYAELDLRILPREQHPQTDSTANTQLQIWMPVTFDIPNGGTTVCAFGQQYHQDLGAQNCQITSDRKIFMNTDAVWGLKPNCTYPGGCAKTSCQLVTSTTVGATGGNDGVKLPSDPGDSAFQVFLASTDANGKSISEYQSNQGTASAQQLPITDTTFQIDSTIREYNQYTIVKIRFTAPLNVPAGYDTSPDVSDPASKNPIGAFQASFNTLDLLNNGNLGFPYDLGVVGKPKVLCQEAGQLTVPDGQKLACTVKDSPKIDINYPAIVTISNFNYVAQGILVGFDLLLLKNGQSYQNNGKVEISASQIDGNGIETQLIKQTPDYVPIYDYFTLFRKFAIWNKCPSSTDIKIDPDVVGAFTKITINNVFANETLNAGDRLTFKFPPAFQFPAPSTISQQISASWDGIQMITTVYPDIQTILLEFPVGISQQANTTHTIQISQLRHAAYAFTSNYSIDFTSIKNYYRTAQCSINNILPPQVAPPISLSMIISSTFSADVYVTYQFKFTPSYTIPKGSSIIINLPTRGSLNYNHISLSTPPAICSVSNSTSMGTCTMSSTALTMIATTDIAENTPLEVDVTRAKNPTFVGQTISSDYGVVIQHPNGFLINKQMFAPFRFLAQKNVGVIYMSLKASNLFKQVTSDYLFTLQSSTFVPPSGLIQLKMPKEWAVILPSTSLQLSLKGSWTSDQLAYTYSIDTKSNPDYYFLNIVNSFSWPSRNSLSIQILKLLNPDLNKTNIFQAQTFYDGLSLDQTDPLDQSLRFSFLSFASGITVNQFYQQPSNQGEVSNYTFELKTPTQIPANGSIQLQFPNSFAPTLSSYDKSVSCRLTFSNGTSLDIPCVAGNNTLQVPISQSFAANDTFTLSVVGIENPIVSSTDPAPQINILTLDKAGNILQYTNNAASVQTSSPPQTMEFTLLKTTSTDLQTKSTYTFCVKTTNTIKLDDQVYIDFPQQFAITQKSYSCKTAAGHSQDLLPYNNDDTSPVCTSVPSLRRIAIRGQQSGYTGDDQNPATLCYQVFNIQNPAQAGPTDNFQISIYSPSTNRTTYQTFGTLSSNTTLSYERLGLQILVATIAPIAQKTSSPPISVTLERTVSYIIELTPVNEEFDFVPKTLQFIPSNGQTMTFLIKPKVNIPIAFETKTIQWTKVEKVSAGQSARFSEVPDSQFEYIARPTYKSLQLTIYPLVSRAALYAVSLPITLTLSQPAASPLVVIYSVEKQSQTIQFNPQKITFAPGETVKSLTYKTLDGAKSGAITFEISDPYYSGVYYMPSKIVNFEILQTDNQPPVVINYYSVNIGRTILYFRASIDESVTLYYLVTLRGSPLPTFDQILTNQSLTSVWQKTGNNISYVAPITNNYIYNDVYLWIQGLTEETDYTLFFYVTDLSGNNNSEVIAYNFTTLPKQLPAQFQIRLKGDVNTSKLIQAFGLATGLPPSRFVIIANPPVFNISGADEPEVQGILSQQTTTYTIMILPDPNSEDASPADYVKKLDQNLDLIKQEIPQVDTSYSLVAHSYEVQQYPQEFNYLPVALNVTEQNVTIQCSIKYSGVLYSILLPIDANKPSSKQISMGLDSQNMALPSTRKHKAQFKYTNDNPSSTVQLHDIFTYPMLFDNSWYVAYFTAQNNRPVNPDLLDDDSVQSVSFKTMREVIVIPKSYVFSFALSAIIVMILL